MFVVMNKSPAIVVQLLVALIVAAPMLVGIGLAGYYPGPDEAVQLEAAVRLVDGNGYTASRNFGSDVSKAHFDKLTAWPPGYSFAIAGLLATGISIDFAPKLFKGTALILLFWGWIKVGNLFLEGRLAQLGYSAAIGLFSVLISSSPTDLVIAGLFSVITLKAILYFESKSSGAKTSHNQNNYLSALVLFAGIAILSKYSALVFMLTVALWIAIANTSDIRRGVADELRFGLPAGAIVGATFLANKARSGQLTSFSSSDEKPRIFLDWFGYAIPDALEALLIEAPLIPRIAIRAVGQLWPELNIAWLRAGALLVALLLIGAISISIWRREQRFRTLLKWLVAGLMMQIAFLCLTMYAYFSTAAGTPTNVIREGRYYQWLIPLLFIAFFAAVDHVQRRSNKNSVLVARVGPLVILVVCFIASCGFSAYRWNVARHVNQEIAATFATLKRIMESEGASGVVIFADDMNFPAVPWKGRFNVFAGARSMGVANSHAGKTVVAMICTTSEIRASRSGLSNCSDEGFDALAVEQKFSQQHTGQSNMLYWKTFPQADAVK